MTIPSQPEMRDPASLPAPYDAPDGYTSEGEAELAEDIKKNGVLVPIVLSARGVVIEGHRRRRASIRAQKLVPVITDASVVTEEQEIAYTLKSEEHRNKRNDAIHARVIQAFMKANGINGKEVSVRLKHSPAKVSRLLGILKWPDDVIDAIGRRAITPAHLQALSKVDDEVRKLELARMAIADPKISAAALAKMSRPPKRKAPSKVFKLVEGALVVSGPIDMTFAEYDQLSSKIRERLASTLKDLDKKSLRVSELNPNK